MTCSCLRATTCNRCSGCGDTLGLERKEIWATLCKENPHLNPHNAEHHHELRDAFVALTNALFQSIHAHPAGNRCGLCFFGYLKEFAPGTKFSPHARSMETLVAPA